MAYHSLTICKKNLRILIIFCGSLLVFGEITIAPKDTEAATGASVILFCKSSLAPVEWHHFRVGGSDHEIVYQNGHFFNGYRGGRFGINRTDNDECNLLINDVRTTDAGKFTCMEKSKVIAQQSAELIVFEHYPSDKACAAKFACAPICDALELACKMKSHGNIVPVMEWRDSANEIVISGSSNDNGVTISSVQLRMNKESTLSYICQVKYPMQSSLSSEFSWKVSDLSQFIWPRTASSVTIASKNEVSQTQPILLIIIVVVMAVALVVLICLFLYMKQKGYIKKHRTTGETGNGGNRRSSNVESGEIPEDSLLLAPVNNNDNKGFLPCTPQNKNKAIYGLGVLDGEIFLLTRESCIIEVFDIETTAFIRCFTVKELINPNDMATSQIKKLIYISDWKKASEDTEIFCVKKNGNLECSWISEKEKGRISITKESNVIVAESWYNTIREFTFSGQLVKKFEVVAVKEKLHLWHAIKLDDNIFVASFGDFDDKIQEICIIDSSQEQILHSITNHSDIFNGTPLSVPRSLAVDKEGNIYVCNLYNARIIVLTSKLEYKDEFDRAENEEKLRGPLRLCLYESSKKCQLLVADNIKKEGKWSDGKIAVWNLSP